MAETTDGSNVMIEGRLVWLTGKSVFEPKQKIDQTTNLPRMDKKGKPMMEYGFGLAVPKTLPSGQANPMLAALWEIMQAEAFKLYPSRQIPPGFAMKYKDGDGIDHNGVSFADRDGQAGHLIFACTTTIQPKFFRWNGAYEQINQGIKCGDYVRVQLNVVAHPAFGQGKPGLYVNPMLVLFLQEGPEIVNTPSGEAVFGASPQIGYAGALPVPTAPQGQMPGGSLPPPQQGQYPIQPQAVAPQAPTGFAQPTQSAPVQPHYAVIPQQFQPPVQQSTAAAPFPQYQQPGVPVMPGFPGQR